MSILSHISPVDFIMVGAVAGVVAAIAAWRIVRLLQHIVVLLEPED